MRKPALFLLSALLFSTGCASQKSATWERVVRTPRGGVEGPDRSRAFAGNVHAELANAAVPHKVVTYQYPYHSKYDGAGTAERTSVVYRDETTPRHPWWLMDERLARPVWLPDSSLENQVAFYLRRAAKIVNVHDYTSASKNVIPMGQPARKTGVTRIERTASAGEQRPVWVVRAYRTVVRFLTGETTAPEPVAEAPDGKAERPAFRIGVVTMP